MQEIQNIISVLKNIFTAKLMRIRRITAILFTINENAISFNRKLF